MANFFLFSKLFFYWVFFFFHFPLKLLYDTVTNAQSQPHPLADILGGKERIENLVQVPGLDAFPVVPKAQQALTIFFQALDPDGCRFGSGSLGAQGVNRVLEQIDADLNELVLVPPDGLVFGEFLLDLDLVLPFMAQETQRRSDQF